MPITGFISDLHLAEEQPERIKLFLRFLERYTPQLDQLYILGDLFEIWLGDDVVPTSLNVVLDTLKQASASTTITIIHGNRDFLMGEQFENLSGCHIVDEPLIINLAGEKALLMHGDLLCTDDSEYLRMREQLRSPSWINLFLDQPANDRKAAAQELRRKSKIAVQKKDSEIMDASGDEVLAYITRHQVDLIIHGHTHRTAIHHHPLSMVIPLNAMYLMSGMTIMAKY